jgi:hypothetical protein
MKANARRNPARCLYQLLFSGAIASALLTAAVYTTIFWSGQFDGWIWGLNFSFHRPMHDGLGLNLAFLIWSLAVAAVVFFLLRVLSWASRAAQMLGTAAGMVLVGLPPACLWFVCRHWPNYYGQPAINYESFGAVVCAALYACNRWRVSVWTTLFLLTVHGALWFRAYSIVLGYRGLCWLTVPILACFATIVWGWYLTEHRRQGGGPAGVLGDSARISQDHP